METNCIPCWQRMPPRDRRPDPPIAHLQTDGCPGSLYSPSVFECGGDCGMLVPKTGDTRIGRANRLPNSTPCKCCAPHARFQLRTENCLAQPQKAGVGWLG